MVDSLFIAADDGTMVSVWAHGRDDWKETKDGGVFIRKGSRMVEEACLGERYVHADYGVDSYGIIWRGSTDRNWHGWAFKDAGEAFAWLREAEHPEIGAKAWAAPENEKFRAVDRVVILRRLVEASKEVIDYRFGRGRYNYSRLPEDQQLNESFDDWCVIEDRLQVAIAAAEDALA